MHILLAGLVVLAQEKIIPQKIIKTYHWITMTQSAYFSFHKMQPDYIYCKYNVYIAFDIFSLKSSSDYYQLSFGTLYKSL